MPAILFDLDSTLFNPGKGILNSFRHTFEHYGTQSLTDDDYRKLIGSSLETSFAQFFNDPKVIDQAIKTYRSIYAKIGQVDTSIYKGIPQGLKQLQDINIKKI